MNILKTVAFVLAVLLASSVKLHAQYEIPYDSSYYLSYAKRLTTRVYVSQKYTALSIRNEKDKTTLHYLPNTTLNLGIGASYKWATLNLAYGFKFLNPDESHGKTRYLDLQFHGYGQRFTLDLLGQFYTGFYLYPKGAVTPGQYYIRPDLYVSVAGGSFQYVHNHRKFSFRASSLQTEWQKKSAGTFLFGLELYGGVIRSDSSLVPEQINPDVSAQGETRTSFFQFGPNAGYAYTLVIDRHFFFTGSGSVSADYGFSAVTSLEGFDRRFALTPNAFFRAVAGYNSALWAFSIVYVNNAMRIAGGTSTSRSVINVGNLRANLVHRFAPGKKEKKILENLIK